MEEMKIMNECNHKNNDHSNNQSIIKTIEYHLYHTLYNTRRINIVVCMLRYRI